MLAQRKIGLLFGRSKVVPEPPPPPPPMPPPEPLNRPSLDAVEIAVALEHQFGVDLQNASSVREYFMSVRAMADYLATAADPEKLNAVLKV